MTAKRKAAPDCNREAAQEAKLSVDIIPPPPPIGNSETASIAGAQSGGRDLSNFGDLRLDEARDLLRRLVANAKKLDDPGTLFSPGALHDFERLKDRWPSVFSEILTTMRFEWKAEVLRLLRERPKAGRPGDPHSPGFEMPPLKSASDLMARKFTPIRWLIPGLLPEGLMVLAARPKVGKSWLALDVAVATATGGLVLGRHVERGDVLYLALEDGDRRMHARLSKLGATGAGLGDLQYATEWPRGTEGAAAIHAWINAHPNARLVVIDVFIRLRATSEGRETAYSTDYSDVSMLKPPPDRAVSILLVHHTRKLESDDPIDSISGTLGIGGAADGAWIIKRSRGADEAELHLIGRDLEEEGAFAVRFDRESCRWQWVGEAWKVRISAERRQVLDALAAQPMKPRDLAKALDKSQEAARKIIHDMTNDGQLERGLDGRYRVIAAEGTF